MSSLRPACRRIAPVERTPEANGNGCRELHGCCRGRGHGTYRFVPGTDEMWQMRFDGLADPSAVKLYDSETTAVKNDNGDFCDLRILMCIRLRSDLLISCHPPPARRHFRFGEARVVSESESCPAPVYFVLCVRESVA